MFVIYFACEIYTFMKFVIDDLYAAFPADTRRNNNVIIKLIIN